MTTKKPRDRRRIPARGGAVQHNPPIPVAAPKVDDLLIERTHATLIATVGEMTQSLRRALDTAGKLARHEIADSPGDPFENGHVEALSAMEMGHLVQVISTLAYPTLRVLAEIAEKLDEFECKTIEAEEAAS